MVDEIPSDPTSQLGLSRSLVWALKAFLKGTIGPGGSGVWTVVQSSDGAEADNTDRWGDTYTPGALICGAAGVAHSWIVLKAPASLSSSLYFLLDCSGSSNQIFMGYSYFSKMGFTGGDLKNRPTALDEVAGSTPSNICDSYTYTHRFNGILSARGDFVFMSFSLGRSLTYAAATLGVMEARPVDTWPFAFLAEAVGYI